MNLAVILSWLYLGLFVISIRQMTYEPLFSGALILLSVPGAAKNGTVRSADWVGAEE